MSRISIARLDQSPLEFDGELLVRTESPSDDCGRQYVVSIHRTDSGGAVAYVPSIKFGSDAPDETCFAIAEVVESAEDVEKFFYVFEPLEHMQREKIDSMSAEDRQTFTQGLFRLYDSAVANALGRFQGLVIPEEQRLPSKPT